MSNPYRESILIVKLREGLYDAIVESGDVDITDLDSISFQKLLVKAVEEFNLREKITVQWYLDGDMIGHDQAKQSKLGDKSKLERVNEFHLSQTPDIEEISEFYLSMRNPRLSEFITGDTFKFLRTYYQEHDRIPYRKLYLKNLDVHQLLSTTADQLERGDIPDDFEVEIQNCCQEFKLELLLHNEFSTILPYAEIFERAATSMGAWISDNPTNRSSEKSSLVTHLDDFYYEGLWRGIACIISRHNVSGPTDEQVEKRRLGELEAQKRNFENRYNALREEADNTGLTLDSISEELPELSDENNSDNTWLEEESITPEVDSGDLPIDEAANMGIDEIVGEDQQGENLSGMIISERRS